MVDITNFQVYNFLKTYDKQLKTTKIAKVVKSSKKTANDTLNLSNELKEEQIIQQITAKINELTETDIKGEDVAVKFREKMSEFVDDLLQSSPKAEKEHTLQSIFEILLK